MPETTTTTSSPIPAPEDFKAVIPDLNSPLCDQIKDAARFIGLFAKFYRGVFTNDREFTDWARTQICSVQCTTTTTTGETTTTGATTPAKLTWTQVASDLLWRGICVSSVGDQLGAVAYGDSIWISRDSGATWTAKDSARNWRSICCSDDFTTLYAVAYGGRVYQSTDSGDTWAALTDTPVNTNRSWVGIACSPDGVKLTAVDNPGSGYSSNDSGVTWFAIARLGSVWRSVTWNKAYNVEVLIDTHGGQFVTAPAFTNFYPGDWRAICFGPFGGVQMALSLGFGFLSNNGSPNSSVVMTGLPSNTWTGICCAQSGVRAVAVSGLPTSHINGIYESRDSGATWLLEEPPRDYYGVACNTAGTLFAAIVKSGFIYIGT